MRKREFFDQLHYYFRKADKDDFKGIVEDCQEQFRIGAEDGLSEEEICCKLGAPKNIYRYYIGRPIIPEENPKMPGEDYDDYADDYYEEPRQNRPRNQSQAYDWEQEPDRRRRRELSEQYYKRPAPSSQPYNQYTTPPPQKRRPPKLHYEGAAKETHGGEEFRWDGDNDISASKIIVNPFLQILGTLFYIASGFLFIAMVAAIIGCLAITSMPVYLYTDLLPLPTLATTTMVYTVLAILFAALTAMYAGQACHDAGQGTKRRGR